MKVTKYFVILIFASILFGCEIRPAGAVYVEPHRTVIVEEPAYEVVIVRGVPVRRVVVVPRHHH